jgi:hypothetical protein
MLAHFIRITGKGYLVFLLPVIIAFIGFILFGQFNWNDQFVLPISLLLSSFIIWFYDGGVALLREGFGKVPKSRHTLFFIEIKYWALILGIIGCVVLGNLLHK